MSREPDDKILCPGDCGCLIDDDVINEIHKLLNETTVKYKSSSSEEDKNYNSSKPENTSKSINQPIPEPKPPSKNTECANCTKLKKKHAFM